MTSIRKSENPHNTQYQGVWVYCEQYRGQLRPVSLELLGQGRQLADELNCTLTAVLLGARVAVHSSILISHGADEVLLAEEDYLAELSDLVYCHVLVDLVQQYKPSIFLLGATSFGRSLAPRVAAALGTGLTADCTILAADKEQGLLLQTRPAFGGNLMATIVTPQHRPQMATVRPHVFSPLAAETYREGRVTRAIITQPTAVGIKLLELVNKEGESINIGDTDILIAVGRGIGSAKNIVLAEKLASLLCGAVAVSRPIVDNGWYGYSHQVGQTGKTVAPKLYIACGISGAIQHISGIAAETLVAINSDPEASIFDYSHYAIVGDCVEFLTTFIEMINNKMMQPLSILP